MTTQLDRTFGRTISTYLPARVREWLTSLNHIWTTRGFLHFANETERKILLVETLTLGPKKTVHLIECAGTRFLVGGGTDGVTALVQIDSTTMNIRALKTELT